MAGKRANIGTWSVADVDALEEALNSLPIRSCADIDGTPPATRPI
ncbi:muconolactone Delta-isomerase family protein [Streptomyces sp. NBC_01187]|nr:muconolactone Delta-isomerase family protein [Streptomyces sp. NBC_01187]